MSIGTESVPQKYRFVIDTMALISYFSLLFNEPSKISSRGLLYIDKVFQSDSNYLMTIPSIVFVEIFDKWFRGFTPTDEEFRAKFISEVFKPIKSCPNIEIRELDIEVLEQFLHLDDPYINLENRDKIVLASAVVLESPLITSDGKIKEYVEKYKNIIPAII
ncbi:MAG: hypothetical protein F6K41_15780 [Symploca sp. SIO3E6]|nr:hypothetical protein [Caldora sp. SIO3E6]